jgi:hypothetical protein
MGNTLFKQRREKEMDRGSCGARDHSGRKRVQDAERAMMQEQEHMGNDENGRSTTKKPEITFEGTLYAIGESLSDVECADDEEDEEVEGDDEADTAHGKLSEDDESGWVMSTITKTVQHHMESFRQKQMGLDKLMQPGWGDTA